MSADPIDAIVEIIQGEKHNDWKATNLAAFRRLFGSETGRYPKGAEADLQVRAPTMSPETGVPFAAYIHSQNPASGPYGGLSFVLFPVEGEACLIGLGVGTEGLAPDEVILGRPGHARKAQAICNWLNKDFGGGTQVAWAKQDPSRTDLSVPESLKQQWPAYIPVFKRYGKEMYALYKPNSDNLATKAAATAFLDLMFRERGYTPIKEYDVDARTTEGRWFNHLLPNVELSEVRGLLSQRRFVILQGPPGTGKTRMATELLREDYSGLGKTIQFHPNTTYETFIGGLAPVQSGDSLGLHFSPKPGFLMEAAAKALDDPRPYLLHIDEINRADLGKILGESIFLLEPSDAERRIDLPYDFGPPFFREFYLPPNLHILGTMNSADRSIAIVDVALRRRFAFMSLWPQSNVVQSLGSPTMQKAFREMLSIFIEHATDDSFQLVPGHSYFLEGDEQQAKRSLRVNLAPLLEEYLSQGYVSGFSEPIRSYLQCLRL